MVGEAARQACGEAITTYKRQATGKLKHREAFRFQ
jgi:hypothetical protein